MTKLLRVCLAGLFIALLAISGQAQTNPKPFVVPELTSWQGDTGTVVPSGRVVLGARSKGLRAVAEAFVADYATMFGRRMTIATGRAKAGDIVLQYAGDSTLGKEGYTLEIGEVLRLSAITEQGVYWGTRTILQLSEQSPTRALPRGTTTDVPRYALRGLLLDVARKYIPMSYLRSLVKVMAYYKMNTLQVHLNDNGFKQFFGGDWHQTSSAFRLESETFPGLASKGASYSKREFIDLQIMAEQHGVEIIPEIDVPAHSLAFSRLIPEIGSTEYGLDHLDLFHPRTYEFVDALFKEYLEGPNPVFRGKRVNIGTDEYSNAKEEVREQFRYFTDRYIRYVQSYGKQVCLWGSLTHAYGKTPVTSQDVVMMSWSTDYADPIQMKEEGFTLVSIPDSYTYIVPAAGYYYDYLNAEMLYNLWTPARLSRRHRVEEGDPALLGGMFAVWNDHYGNGISVKDIHHRVMPAMQVMAQKMWTASATSLPFAEYDKARLALSEAPGVNELGLWGREPRLVYQRDTLSASQRLDAEEIGYDYTVSFVIDAHEEARGTELLRSSHAVVYLADPKEGKLGFARDGYLNTFDYTLPKQGRVRIAVQGNHRETKLFVDGRLRQTLAPQTVYVHSEDALLQTLDGSEDEFRTKVYRLGAKMYYQRTLVFPLRQAGQFRSQISDLRVYNYLNSQP